MPPQMPDIEKRRGEAAPARYAGRNFNQNRNSKKPGLRAAFVRREQLFEYCIREVKA